MLRELKIENLAIIDELDVEFKNGFITLTGETGAGKSIILAGINLLIGEKSSINMIRDGKDSLLAQGVFEITDAHAAFLKNYGIEDLDGELIVRRTLDKNGKTKAFVNNIRVSISDLKNIMGSLVDIVGQHSHQMLLSKPNHLKLLDSFLDENGKTLKSQVKTLSEQYKTLEKEIEKIESNKKEIMEKREFYEYQLNEINKLNLKENEDIKLEETYKKLFNSGKIKEKLEETLQVLKYQDYNASKFLHIAKKNVESIAQYDIEFQNVIEKLDSIYYELGEVIDTLDFSSSEVELEDSQIEKVSKRLDLINRIKNKYKLDIKGILEFRDEVEKKLSLLETHEFDINDLFNKKELIEKDYFKYSNDLSDIRTSVASEIEKNLGEELKFLKMEEATFKVTNNKSSKIDSEGLDDIEFFISTNIGQGLKPLSKIVSGGEVSRIMLAIKVLFSKVDNIPVLIFDEIDIGVGGETVKKIGDKLKEIGGSAQVISITHAPAIAAKSNQQFYIKKEQQNQSTLTTIEELSYDSRINEIARMLSGDKITPSVLDLAKEMLTEN